MHMKAQLATILRRLADRLAPAPAGDCGSGATYINFGGTGVRIDSATSGQVFSNIEFEQGEGWTPA